MPANLENSGVATGLEKVSFHSNLKEKQCQKMFKLPSQLHSSHMLAKQCSKFSKQGSNSMWTKNFQMFKLDLEMAEEPEIKLPTSIRSSKKQEDSRRISTSASLTTPKPLTVWIKTNWKILKEMGIPDCLTCLLRNLYTDQEATVRTRHGTTDWFQIGKGVRQGCTLSPCLFNLYAEYIMWNARLEEAQAGIKTARRNINNLRYTHDTTLMTESKEELKSLLMKGKEKCEKKMA